MHKISVYSNCIEHSMPVIFLYILDFMDYSLVAKVNMDSDLCSTLLDTGMYRFNVDKGLIVFTCMKLQPNRLFIRCRTFAKKLSPSPSKA